MRISDMLRTKGSTVYSVPPDASVSRVLDELQARRAGALVVSPDGEHLLGIVSERDIVRALPTTGAALLDRPVADIMTTDVFTAGLDSEIEALARDMTDRRIRHVPVVVDGRLAGLVSIGDVVKARLDELQLERDQLEAYVQAG